MCNRDSFILLPRESPFPVAWSISYHHGEIAHHLKETGIFSQWQFPYIQIECIGGDVNRWDWDNTPMRKACKAEVSLASWKALSENDLLNRVPFEIFEEPDIPHWLEDNLSYYQDKVGNILNEINPLRNQQERLWSYMIGGTPITTAARGIPEMEDVIRYAHKNSPEVQEFEYIVNGYQRVDGFVHREYSRVKQNPIWGKW